MKKLWFLLLALPLIGMMTSCDDDDKLPKVDISLEYNNATVVDGSVYVVKPDTLEVASVKVTAVREGNKVTNGPVSYWLNGAPIAVNPYAPFGVKVPTDKLAIGGYTLTMEMTVAEEGCQLATAVAQVKVYLVENASDIPESSGGETSQMDLVYTLK